MKAAVRTSAALAVLTLALPPLGTPAERTPSLHLPWKEAGLAERQAAAHLLDRFSYGPRPGEVDQVVRMGLDRWLEEQLAADLPDGPLNERLRGLPALALSSSQILASYPPPGMVLAEARNAGVVTPKDLEAAAKGAEDDKGKADPERRQARLAVLRWAEQQGYHSQRELMAQLYEQKLDRALLSENQLAEVMTDFWYNHFNVSLTDNKSRPYVLSYERDAIRPHALGRVRGLLEATAKHPAMLLYLDNAQSSAAETATTTMQDEMERMPGRRGDAMRGMAGRRAIASPLRRDMPAPGEEQRRVKPHGVNENYARELMELHTLGVDGGYTQQDVVEVARAFTGWTILPPGPRREAAERRLARVRQAGGLGFQADGDFLFRADEHDAGPKTVLGHKLPAGRGIEDGEAVLDLLAVHPATARHLAAQLAVRFVSDKPPATLVDRLTAVYLKTGGDVRSLLRAIAESPEFWSREAFAAKIKSPFELAASSLRALGAQVDDPRDVLQWVTRMGQPLYAFQAPTGFPDRAEAWVNTGALLNRMNFGLQLAAGRVRGVRFDLAKLDGNREPESRQDALRVYAGLLLPGRDLDRTIAQLEPAATAPDLAERIDRVAPQEDKDAMAMEDDDEPRMVGPLARRGGFRAPPLPPASRRPPTAVEQVVGVILGSPEFQRR
jgi:uncharacterized protein (DUF1800 family)